MSAFDPLRTFGIPVIIGSMSEQKWQVNDEAIRSSATSGGLSSLPPIDGRFRCSGDDEDDQMAAYLLKRGLSLCDSGQNEAVATKAVIISEEAVRATIREMKRLALEGGYRLVSVEAGE